MRTLFVYSDLYLDVFTINGVMRGGWAAVPIPKPNLSPRARFIRRNVMEKVPGVMGVNSR